MNQYELSLKNKGMARAAENYPIHLRIAQETARMLAADGRPISIDDVKDQLPGIHFGPWAGSVFLAREFQPCGFTLSRSPGRHCGLIRTWVLKSYKQAKNSRL